MRISLELELKAGVVSHAKIQDLDSGATILVRSLSLRVDANNAAFMRIDIVPDFLSIKGTSDARVKIDMGYLASLAEAAGCKLIPNDGLEEELKVAR